MQKREFTQLNDPRLLRRGNKILQDLFRNSVHSIRQVASDEASAKGAYRFLLNDNVSEQDITFDLSVNCRAACAGRPVVCIQDTSQVNLGKHTGRIKKDKFIGPTNNKNGRSLGFFMHPSLVVDAMDFIPYGYADIKLWSRTEDGTTKYDRDYTSLPTDEKESYKWIEVSKNTKDALSDVVPWLVIVQDREGDIYEQFADIPDDKTALLVRASSNRQLADKSKLFSCLSETPLSGTYSIAIPARNGRAKRQAKVEVRFKQIEICKPSGAKKGLPQTIKLFLVEAKEVDYNGSDGIHWRLLTTLQVKDFDDARTCIEWYSWRWMVEEVFKIVKKEGFDIEASELEYASSVRKLTLMIMEVIIKLFLMRLAYSAPETDIAAESCFTHDELEFLEHQIKSLEGKTEKQKNPFKQKQLKRYTWAIARLGGWKGYESKRRPGITTLWIGMRLFKAAYQGWKIKIDVSTR